MAQAIQAAGPANLKDLLKPVDEIITAHGFKRTRSDTTPLPITFFDRYVRGGMTTLDVALTAQSPTSMRKPFNPAPGFLDLQVVLSRYGSKMVEHFVNQTREWDGQLRFEDIAILLNSGDHGGLDRLLDREPAVYLLTSPAIKPILSEFEAAALVMNAYDPNMKVDLRELPRMPPIVQVFSSSSGLPIGTPKLFEVSALPMDEREKPHSYDTAFKITAARVDLPEFTAAVKAVQKAYA